MIDVKVIEQYRDRVTNDLHEVDSVIKVTNERFEELSSLGKVVEIKEEKVVRSTKEDKTVIQTK